MKNRLDWELFSIFVNNFFEEELNVWEIKKICMALGNIGQI